MLKRSLLFFILFAISAVQAQEVLLPTDFRQHNLTEYNSSFLSPVFTLDRNNPESIAIWSRWQWQTIDADPTSLFLNYSRRLNEESAAGIGFFQNNTGVFLQSGGVLNYAFALDLESDAQIAFGLNLFGFVRSLADNFQPDPNIGLPVFEETNDFILRLAPSLRFKLDRFSIGIVAENLMDYNFRTKEKATGPMEKIYIGLASYSFPVTIFGSAEESFIQPTVYMKTLPTYDNQFGITTLFSTPKFWVQAGYNNFYGISGGAGARVFKRFSLGALLEFGSSTELDGTDPSFEIVSSYKLGPIDSKKKIIKIEEEEEEELPLITEQKEEEEEAAEAVVTIDKKEERKLEKEAKLALKQRKQDSLVDKREQERLAKLENRANRKSQDSIAEAQKRLNLVEAERMAQRRSDSLSEVRKREYLAREANLAVQKSQDSLDRLERQLKIEKTRQLAERKKQDSLLAIQEQEKLAAKTKDSLVVIQKAKDLAEAQRKQEALAAVERTKALEEARKIAAQKTKDSLAAVQKANDLAEAQRKQAALAAAQRASAIEEARRIAAQKTKDSLENVKAQEKLAVAARLAEQRKQDSLATIRMRELEKEALRVAQQKTRDSLAQIRAKERVAAAKQEAQKRIQDSISNVKEAEAEALKKDSPSTEEVVVEPEQGEKYEEALTEDGLEPGFYLIANVFGTKRYFDSFMVTLKDEGLRPRSFFRSLNNYNYVYLQRYDSMTEARKARDSKFNGRYDGKTWIFRAVPK